MRYDHAEQVKRNRQAIADPRPGDYWNEMFCPYFIVVDRRGDDFTVLSCLTPDLARIDHGDGTWSFDYSKSKVVDREWIQSKVRYQSIDGFVADVVNSEKTQAIVSEWRDYYQKSLLKEIDQLQSRWEEFVGWKQLKQTDKEKQ